MKFYDFTNCKPLHKDDVLEEKELWNEWNKILQKDEKYKDIEAPSKLKNNEVRLRFTRGHIRWTDYYKSKQFFLTKYMYSSEFYRIIGIFCHHGPVKEKYKEALLLISEGYSEKKAAEKVNSGITYPGLRQYLHNNFYKMRRFVLEFEDENT